MAPQTPVLDEFLTKKREQMENNRKVLLQRTLMALRAIRDRYVIEDAYVVGSLASPGRWSEFSDIDVAVSGASAHVLAVMKELEEATGRTIDVIDLDHHPAPDFVRRKGIRVYE
jgi:predicted nucleotidyltransferase